MKICGIYKITNPSGKIYIGQTIDFKKRLQAYKGCFCKSQIVVYRSLKKYGYDKHQIEIIEQCDKDMLNERERYWQEFYDVVRKGLNCFLVNTKNKKGVWSDESKRKASISSKKRKASLETRMKMSNSSKKRWANTDRSTLKLSDECRKRMSDLMKKNKNGLKNLKKGSNVGLPVVQLDKYFNIIKEYASQAEASLATGCDASGIHRCANGKQKYCKGFIWRYKYVEHIGNKKTYTKNMTLGNLTINNKFLNKI